MPYSAQHKQKTREKIVESARILFNRHGFQEVTIDQVMEEIGMTRGGFYNHFSSKDELYSLAVESFMHGRGAQWRGDFNVNPEDKNLQMALGMIEGYLSAEHLNDTDAQCPMIALPSDVARATPEVQASYQKLLGGMVHVFQTGVAETCDNPREKALAMAALCIGGMIIARTLPDSGLADEVRRTAYDTAREIAER